jgi:hypothetical protein
LGEDALDGIGLPSDVPRNRDIAGWDEHMGEQSERDVFIHRIARI